MMQLTYAPNSPFVRKVRIAAAVLGLADRITVHAADKAADARVRAANPLVKAPVLMLANGDALYDSRVILDYLDHLAGGGRIIPTEPDARFAALKLQALADGVLDASILLVYETVVHPEAYRFQGWIDQQTLKVTQALAALERDLPPPVDALPHVGQIALACALGYRDFRFAGEWRSAHPRLVGWLDGFAARVPAYGATMPGVTA